IFATDGEPAFRALEERVCLRLLHQTGVVVALGGGAVTSPLIRERLRDGSFTVLLDVSPQTAWRRIEAGAGDRPLAAEARGFAELYEQRRGLYHASADALVDAEEVNGDEDLLAPIARPGAPPELPRLIGAPGGVGCAGSAMLSRQPSWRAGGCGRWRGGWSRDGAPPRGGSS